MTRPITIAILLSSLFLSGCETSKKLYQVITDPEVPVGYPEQEASEIEFSFLADKDINPNLEGESTPTDIQVVYLEDDARLLSTTYYQIATQPLEALLGKNYVNHQDYAIEPDQYKILKPVKVEPNAQFMAVIAHYAGADSGQVYWLDITDIETVGKKYRILIHLRLNEVEIKKM